MISSVVLYGIACFPGVLFNFTFLKAATVGIWNTYAFKLYSHGSLRARLLEGPK